MGVVFIVLALAAAGVVAYLSWQAKLKRRTDLGAFAARQGLTFTEHDPFRLDQSYLFDLFSRGDGRGCENVMAGTWNGLDVIEADYWYYEESTDSEGRTSRSYSRFSVAVVALDAVMPNVKVERENVLTRLADHVGLSDIEFELEEFNRSFNVKAKDREFAFKLIDARMMEWLLQTPHKACVEVVGPHALVWCKRLGPAELGELFLAVKGFVDHVPRLVWNEYGKAAS